MQAFTQKSLP